MKRTKKETQFGSQRCVRAVVSNVAKYRKIKIKIYTFVFIATKCVNTSAEY